MSIAMRPHTQSVLCFKPPADCRGGLDQQSFARFILQCSFGMYEPDGTLALPARSLYRIFALKKQRSGYGRTNI